MKSIYLGILILVLIAALAGPLLAQISIHFDLGWHVLSGGGGTRTSDRYQIADVLGQWPDGLTKSAHYRIDPGFWFAGREMEPECIYLPVVLK